VGGRGPSQKGAHIIIGVPGGWLRGRGGHQREEGRLNSKSGKEASVHWEMLAKETTINECANFFRNRTLTSGGGGARLFDVVLASKGEKHLSRRGEKGTSPRPEIDFCERKSPVPSKEAEGLLRKKRTVPTELPRRKRSILYLPRQCPWLGDAQRKGTL